MRKCLAPIFRRGKAADVVKASDGTCVVPGGDVPTVPPDAEAALPDECQQTGPGPVQRQGEASQAGPPPAVVESETQGSPPAVDTHPTSGRSRATDRGRHLNTGQEDADLQAAIALSLADTTRTVVRDNATARPAMQPEPFAQLTLGGDADPTAKAESEALDQLTEMLANCAATGQTFIDPEFVPAPKSLYVNGQCRARDAARLAVVQHFNTHVNEIQWLSAGSILQRPDDLQMEFASQEEMVAMMHQFSKHIEWKVFQSDPSPSDISQGGLGNCWFCGSLAAVSEKPELIRRLFVDPCSRVGDLSKEGIYIVRLCDGGIWRHEIIDGLFPCNKMRMLAFSGARRNQLWVPLVEKAYAKLRGCYEAMEAGTPAEGLRLFTGWPSILQELRPVSNSSGEESAQALRTQAMCPFADEDTLWLRLVSAYESKLIICGSCGHVEGISDEDYRGMGLSPSHCYSIVKIATAQQGTLRLLKLRNPWGTGRKWVGKYSDSDTENWSAELKAEVGAEDLGAEGIFWMSLEDIRKYFASITICPFRDGWAEARRIATWPASAGSGSQPAFLLDSQQSQEVLLSVMQPEERASRTMMTADAGLALFKLPDNADFDQSQPMPTLKSLQGAVLEDSIKRRVQDSLICDCHLKGVAASGARSRVLAVPISFNQRESPTAAGNEKDFVFACFSPSKLQQLRQVALSADAHREAIVGMVKKTGRRTRLSVGIDVYEVKDSSGLIVLMENLTMETCMIEGHLTQVFNMQVSRGLVCTSDGEQFLHYRDTLPPVHGMITFIAAAMPGGHNFTYRSECRILREMEDIHDPALAQDDTLHRPFFLEGVTALRQPRRGF
mmetsp:Transcript_43530/g.100199  ORF Transcript_43530/g.100199 Transcript_43530/m.100199 type:complete len:839 (-) Transcript_43530:106-2622(-)